MQPDELYVNARIFFMVSKKLLYKTLFMDFLNGLKSKPKKLLFVLLSHCLYL